MLLQNSFLPSFPEKERLQKTMFSGERMGAFLLSLLQFTALLFLIRQFNIEKSSGIVQVTPLILGAFLINSFIPLRFRQLLLLLLSFTIIFFAFGWFSGSFLILTGLSLVACCHLPLPFWLRVAAIACISTGIFILRADLFYAPRGSLVAPFIASMFMFRLILYLYEIKHKTVTAPLIQGITYFFLFPNTCFLFFPTIDYKNYVKTYYSASDTETWQKGIRWMLRGLIHILAYRIVYYYAVISPQEITGLSSLLRYIFSSYALILRLSGLFHFIIGMLCMFGVNLPQPFNNYFLATNFTDLWRRINIYWREFVLKIFFYPLLFKIKRVISKNSLAVTMSIVFIISWALHGYQWFWIRGYYIFNSVDLVFWLILGGCITMNAVIQEKRLESGKSSYSSAFTPFLKTAQMMGMLLFMSVIWSLWGSHSFSEWFYLLSKCSIYSTSELLLVIGLAMLIFICIALLHIVLKKTYFNNLITIPPHKTQALTFTSIVLLLLVSSSSINSFLPSTLRTFVESLAVEKLNKSDKTNEEEGYYQKLIDGESNNATGLWEVNLKRPKKFTTMDDVYIRTDDILTKVFRPSKKITGNNYTLETNSFGMRDKNYSFEKPAKTFRMALLGGSYEMGSGVNNDAVYESLVEENLNHSNTDSLVHHFEIMNFACGGFYLIQHVELVKTKVFQYKPDAVLYVAHTGESWRIILTLTNLIRQGTNLKYPLLEELKKVTGIKQSMSKTEIEDRLTPYTEQLIKWSYEQIALECYRHNAIPVWAFLPATTDSLDLKEYTTIQQYASNLGFVTLDLRGVYPEGDRKDLMLSEWNTHPNPKGHQLIANKLYDEFLKHKRTILSRKKID